MIATNNPVRRDPAWSPPENAPNQGSAAQRPGVLPAGCLPLGLSRVQAAAYIGVSPGLFDAMVADGRMPQPKQLNARTVWDRRSLEEAFAGLPARGQGSSEGLTAAEELDTNPFDEPE